MIIVNFKGGERNEEKRKIFVSNVYPFLILKYHQIRLKKIISNKKPYRVLIYFLEQNENFKPPS
jgi:hypothetical protein